jgi:hypothetical protein
MTMLRRLAMAFSGLCACNELQQPQVSMPVCLLHGVASKTSLSMPAAMSTCVA